MPKTHIERVWLAAGGVVAALLLLIGYMMFISPQNAKTSSEQSAVSTANSTNQRLESRIAALRAESKDLPKYQSDLAAAELALPTTSGLPDFLRTLQSIGNATLTTLSSLAVGPPTDVTSVAAGSSTNRTAQSASSGGLRVYALPITAQVTGSTSALDQFLTELQTVQPRAVLISQLTEASATGGTGASGTASGTALQLTMDAFVAPSSPAEQAQLSLAAGK
jgi:type IV pilus assembly protein PilO